MGKSPTSDLFPLIQKSINPLIQFMLLALALLVPGIRANDANDTFAANYLTILAKLLNRCAYFHSLNGVMEWWSDGTIPPGITPTLQHCISPFHLFVSLIIRPTDKS